MTGNDVRKKRKGLKLSLHVLGALTKTDPGLLCRYELGTYAPSEAVRIRVVKVLDAVQEVRRRHGGVPIDMTALAWLRAQIGNVGQVR
jgi:predicted transcriptional regulator